MTTLAVLFDFDGVIADTENVHVAAWERTFAAMGWDVAPEVCAQAMEVDDRVFLTDIFARPGIEGDGDVVGWVRRKQDLTASLLADAPRLNPGVPELIGRLRGKTKLAIVSTTDRENIDAVLGPAGLIDAFDVIVSKKDARVPKPSPEPYRWALKRLGVPAWEARAIEDSHAGWTSARAGGLFCLVVGRREFPKEQGREGPLRVDDLRDTEKVMRLLGAC
jgi:HAD superfamily hydrolase (TIGR01509 family)